MHKPCLEVVDQPSGLAHNVLLCSGAKIVKYGKLRSPIVMMIIRRVLGYQEALESLREGACRIGHAGDKVGCKEYFPEAERQRTLPLLSQGAGRPSCH